MTVTVTAAQLRKIVGGSPPFATQTADAFNKYAAIWGISDTPLRAAHFFAQICHESKLRYAQEIWGPTAAQKRYEGRKDLGNVRRGDGKRFMGHGLLQITGRANHAAFTVWIKKAVTGAPDFEAEPERLGSFPWSFLGACWFWDTRGLNKLADRDDVLGITKKVNGGTNGLADRKLMLARAKAAFKADDMHIAGLLGRPLTLLDEPDLLPDDELIEANYPEDALKPYEIEALQLRLRELGYYTVGGANQDYGGGTRGAVIAFQTDHGIHPDGHYTDETREALADNNNTRPIAEARANTTPKDLLERGSRTVAATQEIKKTSILTYGTAAITTAGGAVVQYGSDAVGYLATAKEKFADLPWWWLGPLLLVIIVAYLHRQGAKAEAARVDDEQKFKNTADPSPKLVNRILGQESSP